MITKRLYDTDAYLTEFEATVVECRQTNKDGEIEVVIDQTAFFPEQGGQTCDKGVIALDGKEYFVKDVQIDQGVIVHTIESTQLFAVGEIVCGKIDFAHRFNNMQNHTGEHMFTGIAHVMFGCDNVGFHLSDNTVTLDLNKKLTDEQIRLVEKTANQKISENHRINCFYPSVEKLNEIDYRCKSGIEGDVRLVEIETVDVCACCAPHVAMTSEVGMLIVTGWINYKGGVRVEILCGNRAFEYIRKSLDIVNSLKSSMKCAPEELVANVESQTTRLKNAEYELAQAKSLQLMSKLESIPTDQNDVILFVDGEFDGKALRDGVNKLVGSHNGICAIFAGNDDDGYSFNVGMASVSDEINCNIIAQKLRIGLSAKCGGTNEMITGKVVAARERIQSCLD